MEMGEYGGLTVQCTDSVIRSYVYGFGLAFMSCYGVAIRNLNDSYSIRVK